MQLDELRIELKVVTEDITNMTAEQHHRSHHLPTRLKTPDACRRTRLSKHPSLPTSTAGLTLYIDDPAHVLPNISDGTFER